MKNVQTWIKENKKKIAIGTACAVGTIGAGVIYYKFGIKPKGQIPEPVTLATTYQLTKNFEQDTLPINLGMGTVHDLWRAGDYINLVVDDVNLGDMGKFGECITNVISDTNDRSTVTAVISLLNPEEIIDVTVEESL